MRFSKGEVAKIADGFMDDETNIQQQQITRLVGHVQSLPKGPQRAE
jgi:hypothetical protein